MEYARQAASEDIATTTFGPLDKYVAVNDNFAGAKRFGEKGGLVDLIESGQYIGLTRDELLTPAQFVAEGGYRYHVEPPRPGQFMQTFTGRQYWPLSPQQEDVCIEDIAHSLSMQCRYAGHCIQFYSVAEHSVLIANWLLDHHGPRTALAGLLHDAPETYLVDIPRPLKPYLTNYKDIEQKNWLVIAARFGVPAKLPEAVHQADNRIIADELVNLRQMEWHDRHKDGLGVELKYWPPAVAEAEFLAAFDALSEMVRERVGRV